MSDLLVKLYELPDLRPFLEVLESGDFCIRKARAWEKHQVVEWVGEAFGKLWASECDVAFSHQPITCFLATKNRELVGFACYESSSKNFFGPMGVIEIFRGKGVGKALLLSCLWAMNAEGYGYAIIGDADSLGFYEKVVNAWKIPDSSPGIYQDRLKIV